MNIRDLINIVETAQRDLPQVTITDEIIREMIATDRFVSHGSEVSQAWEHGLFEYKMEELGYSYLIGNPYDEVKNTPEFFAALKTTITALARTVEAKLRKLNGNTYLFRGVQGSFKDGSLGVYWSTDRNQARRFADGGPIAVAYLKNVTVDWDQTIKSRLDLTFQDEEEITLMAGTNIRNAAIYDNDLKNIFTKGDFSA